MSDYKVMMHLQDEARSMSDLPGKPEPFNPAARIAELEAKWAHTVDALRAAHERIAELEAEVIGITSRWEECVDRYSRLTAASLLDEARIAELEALSAPDAVHRHYMRGYNAAKSNYLARIAELEAERDKAREAGHEEVLSFVRNGRFLHNDALTAKFAREIEGGWKSWGKAEAEKRRP